MVERNRQANPRPRARSERARTAHCALTLSGRVAGSLAVLSFSRFARYAIAMFVASRYASM